MFFKSFTWFKAVEIIGLPCCFYCWFASIWMECCDCLLNASVRLILPNKAYPGRVIGHGSLRSVWMNRKSCIMKGVHLQLLCNVYNTLADKLRGSRSLTSLNTPIHRDHVTGVLLRKGWPSTSWLHLHTPCPHLHFDTPYPVCSLPCFQWYPVSSPHHTVCHGPAGALWVT